MDTMDELLSLTRRFHLSDIEDNGLACSNTSESLAFTIYMAELEEFGRLEKDRIMAASLDEATKTDGDLLEKLAAIDKMIEDDREYAIALQAGRAGISRPSSRSSTSTFTSASTRDTASTATSSLYSPSYSPLAPLTSSSRAPPVKMVECVICNDRVISTKAIQVPCAHSHWYDIGCAKRLFLAAMTDESLFPPRCDRVDIPPSLIFPHFTLKERREFTEKSVEFTTVNRLYCSNKLCSKFLGKGTEAKSSTRCDNCGTSTCGGCKNGAHAVFGVCSLGKDDETKENLKTQLGFQECPRCQIMVELESGCFHMTCRCSSQFCYLCAAPWKTCTCPQWEEGRLFRAADVRLEAVEAARVEQNIPAPAVLVPRAERVLQMANELRNNHDCAHENWYLRHGRAQCESCFHTLDRYLLRCRGCAMMACVRCQRNRL